jgi:filamentous hemagglutinin family protein
MNHVYRLVWSHVRNGWVAVAETARRRHKGSGRTLLATTLTLATVLAHAGQPGPVGGRVVSGSGGISTSGNTTTITQTSPTLSLTWLSFDIAPQQTVDFVQPSASAIAINHILSSSGSEILGHLNANGQIYLINPNGILFGKGAEVNVGGLVASTLTLDDGSPGGSRRSFSGTGTGSVINRGTITAADGGFVALIGNTVINQGSIVARLGSVALGAGSSVTLTFASDTLVGMQVDRSTLHDVAANGGLIQADGGRVTMSAGAKDALLASVVNNTGVIEARTVADHDGTITLLGGMTAGTVNVGGTLDASAPGRGNGGTIETSAAHVKVAADAKVTTAAAHGLMGSWVIDPQDFTVAASGGDETGAQLGTALDSTNVQLESSAGGSSGSGNVNIDDSVAWSANTTLTLTASNNVNVNASITATGSGAGLVLDPDTANGTETASGSGKLDLAPGAAINLPNVPASSATALVIGGQSYTVINSLGAAGSATGTDLQGINGNPSGFYALGSDVDASGTSAWSSGTGFTPIGSAGMPFTGTLDGLGHTISNLTIDLPGSDDVGLFGVSHGTVRNVGITGAAVTGGAYATGGLVGLNYGTVAGSHVSGSVRGSLNGTGGLVGTNYGTVTGSYAAGTVAGVDNAGGLVGLNNGAVSDSHATAAVTGAYSVGGLVGDSSSTGTIDAGYATGSVQGAANVGGLVGFTQDTVANSYATGSVTANGQVGGLVGGNYGSITTSYSSGAVSGGFSAGGLVGTGPGSTSDSFWNATTSGQSSSHGGTSLTSAQMLSAANFTGFSFTTTPGATGNSWVIVDADGSLNNAAGAAGATSPMLASGYSTAISDAQQLQLMAMAPGASYSLAADIDATATDGAGGVWGSSGFAPIGSSAAPFTGTLDGLGHTVSGLSISQTSSPASNTGLLGYVGGTGVVSNIALAGASVAGYGTVGALAGTNAGTITNSSAAGTVSASFTVGGLVGANYGTISNSQSTAAVSSRYSTAGGLVGSNSGAIGASHATGAVTSSGYGTGGLAGSMNSGGSVTGSYATGTVTANGTYGRRAGGLVGTGYGGSIADSYASGTVSGNHAIGGLVGALIGATVSGSFATGDVAASNGQGGGLVGVNLASVSDSYATGSVSGSGTQFGGLVGGNGGTVSDSYATGTVAAATAYVGGLVGGNYGTVTDSYAAGSVTGSSQVGGLVGGNQYGRGATSGSYWDETTSGESSSAGGTGLTTAEMQQQSGFSGWDFAHTWVVYGGETYPLLQSFLTPLIITAGDTSVTYSGSAYSGGNGASYSLTPGSALLGTLSYGGSSQGAVAAGTYAITPEGLYSDQQGYLISYVSGTLTVDPATLTYAAAPASVTAGQSPSGLSGTVTGLLGSDTLATATSGTLDWTSPATASSPSGSYAIEGGGLTAANYVFTQAPANATALTVTAAASGSSGTGGSGSSSGSGTGGSSSTGGSTAGGGAGDTSNGAGSSSGSSAGGGTTIDAGNPPPATSPRPPQSVLDAVAGLDAGVLPSWTGSPAPPSRPRSIAPGGSRALTESDSPGLAGDLLELGGQRALRVEDGGVRLPSLLTSLNP